MGRPDVGPTYNQSVTSTKAAIYVSRQLVFNSVWFECTPYPDDWFHFKVKAEWGNLLRDLVEKAPR